MDTPLHLAATKQRHLVADIINLLLVHGADLKLKNMEGKTPVSIAKSFSDTSKGTYFDMINFNRNLPN